LSTSRSGCIASKAAGSENAACANTGVAIAADRTAATLSSLKLVIVECLHVVETARSMREPLTGRLETAFWYSRAREIVNLRSQSAHVLATRLASMPIRRRLGAPELLVYEPHEPDESQLAHEYIIAPKQHTFPGREFSLHG
jgi:hypothetical protein